MYTLRTRRECVHAFFSASVLATILEPVNDRIKVYRHANPRRLDPFGQQLYRKVTPPEFMVWLSVFMLRMVGVDPIDAHLLKPELAAAVHSERYQAIKRCLHIMSRPHGPVSQEVGDVSCCGYHYFCIVTYGRHKPLQEQIKAMHAFEQAIFKRARDLVLVDKMVASLDDWEWKYSGKDCPVRRLLSNGSYGWTADALVSTPEHFVLGIRKRGLVRSGPTDNLEEVSVCVSKLLEQVDAGKRSMLLVMDRGYMQLDRATWRTPHLTPPHVLW